MPTSVKRTTTVRASWPSGIKYFGATIGRRQRQNALVSSRVDCVLIRSAPSWLTKPCGGRLMCEVHALIALAVCAAVRGFAIGIPCGVALAKRRS